MHLKAMVIANIYHLPTWLVDKVNVLQSDQVTSLNSSGVGAPLCSAMHFNASM